MVTKKNKNTAETAKLRTERVKQWVTSPEGQEAIAASLQKARSLAAQFREAERVDPENLNKPFNL